LELLIACAPAKVIITGEHFVVHGQPALAAAVSLYSRAAVDAGAPGIIKISSPNLGVSDTFSTTQIGDKDLSTSARSTLEPLRRVVVAVLERAARADQGLVVEVTSNIPVGVGLGSSASTAVSTAFAVARFLDLRIDRSEICELASVQERIIHKKPSGIDSATTARGGIILFKIGESPASLRQRDQFSIVVGNSGKERSTGDLVSAINRRVEVGDKDLARISEAAGMLTNEAVHAYKKGDFHKLGELMDSNHELLVKIGVSTPQLDRLVKVAKSAGALGAKLTGAGGGGCVIALSRPEDSAKIAEAIADAGAKPYLVGIDWSGVRELSQGAER
jgi:mevalonate kinase